MKLQLLPKIQALSMNDFYRDEWILVKTYPKTNSKIYCLCDSVTKNYRLYFNIRNGNILRVGLDCREIHSESFSELKLSDKPSYSNDTKVSLTAQNMSNLLGQFLSCIEFLNYNNINDWISGTKNPETIITKATIDLIDNHKNTEYVDTLYQTLETLSILIVVAEKYRKYFRNKIQVLKFQSVLNTVEQEEIVEKNIYQQETESYMTIRGKFVDFKKIEDLELAEKYLANIPSIISNNLRKTYPLPQAIWQLQQTNGYLKHFASLRSH